MRDFRLLVLLPAIALVCTLAAHAQDDAPSLGDVARQARQQKQKDTPSKPVPADAATQTQNAQSNTLGKDAQAKDTQNKDGLNKDARGKDSAPSAQKTAHVITNDEIPSHIGPTATTPAALRRPNVDYGKQEPYDEAGQRSAAAPSWTSQIQSSKMRIESLKGQIDQISSTIQYAGGNCVSGCVQWNENQKRKQDQVETMKGQLEQEQQHLDQLQDQCSRQGYGSSVCDP